MPSPSDRMTARAGPASTVPRPLPLERIRSVGRRPGRPKGSKNKRGSYQSIFADFQAARRMQEARELERKAPRVASTSPAPPSRPRRVDAPPPLGPRVYVYAQIHHGDGAADPGQINEGRFSVAGNRVHVEDMRGQSLGSHVLQPGENAATVARQVLRKGAPTEFWRALPIARVPV
jgi:hypothetical protein